MRSSKFGSKKQVFKIDAEKEKGDSKGPTTVSNEGPVMVQNQGTVGKPFIPFVYSP